MISFIEFNDKILTNCFPINGFIDCFAITRERDTKQRGYD